MTTIHLVYAGQPRSGMMCAPHTITNNLYDYLASKCDVKYYQWDDKTVADVRENDIFIGHPNYGRDTIVQRTFAEKRCKLMCTIHPLHTAEPSYNMPFDWIAQKADIIFSICGKYWTDTIHQTPFSSWADKIVRLDMAVDCNHYAYRKHEFNPPGNRSVAYVGSNVPVKNVNMLTEIAKRMPDTTFEWYGCTENHPFSELPNTRTYHWQLINGNMFDSVCSNDILISTSTSDANPTTLLEFGLASGLIPVCTETSGYYNDECFINIPNNVDGAIEILSHWLHQPPDVLKSISLRNRDVCLREYTWSKFCETVWNSISQYVE